MEKKLHIVVIGGAGHVGLPLSLVLAKKGFKVTVVDIDGEKINSIRKGEFPFLEEGGAELLNELKDDIHFTTEHKYVQGSDVVLLTVGTPVDGHLNPVLKPVYETLDQLFPYLDKDQVIVLRSTLFPGTSQLISDYLLNKGLEIGVSFCPERIVQGYAIKEIQEIPQIISGVDSRSLNVARHIFSALTEEVIELEMEEAEIFKLFTNACRYITFAVANQFYMMAEEKGMDFYKIRDAITSNYPRADFFPKAGFTAGPCLFKDTMQLAAFNRQNFPLGNSAMLVNETLPDFLVDQAKGKFPPLKGKKVGILGMAFKAENDDPRESLAYKLRRLLNQEQAIVMSTDPYIDDPSFVSVEEVLNNSEIIFIGCPHREYHDIDFSGKNVFDCWGIGKK